MNVPPDFISDGCTFAGILKLFKGILGSSRYHMYCIEHDFLRRHNVINWFKSNILLAKRIASHGLVGKLRAPFYLIATTITYPFYSKTQPLPAKWQEYANYYRN